MMWAALAFVTGLVIGTFAGMALAAWVVRKHESIHRERFGDDIPELEEQEFNDV